MRPNEWSSQTNIPWNFMFFFKLFFLDDKKKYAIKTLYRGIEKTYTNAYLLFLGCSKLPTIHYRGNSAVVKHQDCFKTLPPVEFQIDYQDHLTAV